jgi:hypothetical protein
MGNIDISTLFGDLGIVSGNTNSKNQYEFYYGIVWDDDTITYNQYEFFQKVGMSRYDFFKQYGGEFEFYSNISDPSIIDYKTFYEYAGSFLTTPTSSDWILKFGYWEDNYFWVDTDVWKDVIIG